MFDSIYTGQVISYFVSFGRVFIKQITFCILKK